MGMALWEWEGMGVWKAFPHTSTYNAASKHVNIWTWRSDFCNTAIEYAIIKYVNTWILISDIYWTITHCMLIYEYGWVTSGKRYTEQANQKNKHLNNWWKNKFQKHYSWLKWVTEDRELNQRKSNNWSHTVKRLKVKRLNDIALLNKSSQSYEVSLAICDHTVLPSTWNKWTHPALTPVRRAGTWFTYPGGVEGWVDLGGWVHTEMVYLSADSHPSK